ncbi:amidase family protein [Ferrimicrobium sp.]|uniref:amidase family protein n=1 Tax=Ferrimicrobium sp. TaxID=2926050 RepID=UPI00262367FA|nr:amidase family protein [Ferrimicrobium sp.]
MHELRTIQDFVNLPKTATWGSQLIEALAERQHNDGLSALLSLANPDQAFGQSGVLAGLPILVKDNIDTMDLPTTAGSWALSLEPPRRDATVVARLRAGGATIAGKTNLSEWANFRGFASVSGWSGRGGIARNPYDRARSTGGSSSGSAAAVAAGYVPIAIGTETDGSVLCPAAMNGVVGFKSTAGAIDRTGVVPLSRSQDSVGIFANRVADARRIAQLLVDPPHKVLRPNFVVVDSMLAQHNPKVVANFEEVIGQLVRGGFSIARLPATAKGTLTPDEDAELIVLAYEMAEDLDRYLQDRRDPTSASLADLIAYNDAHPEKELTLFGQELLLMGFSHPWDEATYLRALSANRDQTRTGLASAMSAADADIILAPTMGAAWLIDTLNGDPSIPGSWSAAAVAGYPSLTLPIGLLGHLPIGMTMISQAHTDLALLERAEEIQATLERDREPILPPAS